MGKLWKNPPTSLLQSLSGGEFLKMFFRRAAQSLYNMVYK
jgi:hypothetical protein